MIFEALMYLTARCAEQGTAPDLQNAGEQEMDWDLDGLGIWGGKWSCKRDIHQERFHMALAACCLFEAPRRGADGQQMRRQF